MKNLLGLLSALIFLIASCSDSGTGTDPESKFQQYKVGFWTINGENSAEWDGKGNSSSIKSISLSRNEVPDTLTYESPEQNMMGMEYSEDADQYRITYRDSTITDAFVDSTDAEPTFNLINGNSINDAGRYVGGNSVVTEDFAEFYVVVDFECNVENEPIDNEYFSFGMNQSGPGYYRIYRILVGDLDAIGQSICSD